MNPYGVGNDREGACFVKTEDIDPSLISIINDSDKVLVAYNGNTMIHLKSSEHIGSLKVFPSKYGANGNPCVSVRKGPVLERLRDLVKQKVKKPVRFFAKEQSDYIGCYLECVLNEEGERCVPGKINGAEALIPVKELPDHTGTIFAVMKSKPLKKSEKNDELMWSFVITELSIEPLPENYEGYFVRHSKPSLLFLNKM